MNYKLPAILLAAALAGGSATAAAPGTPAQSSSYAIGISGFVPVICRASIDATIVSGSGGTTDLGALNEFCNSPHGYQVYVEGSAELAGATLLVNGSPVPLAAQGPTLISASSGPAIESRQVSLQTPGGNVNGTLSVSIVAL